MRATLALAVLLLAAATANAQQETPGQESPAAREAAERMMREGTAETYCSDDARGPLPGFDQDTTDEACDIIDREEND